VNARVSLVEKLKKEYGVRTVLNYGQCIAIPEGKFLEEWSVDLGRQGVEIRRHAELPGGVCTLVKLRPEHLTEERTVYSPEPDRKEISTSVPGTDWPDDEDSLIIKMWNARKSFDDIRAKFPKRTDTSVKNRIRRLQQKGLIKPRWTHGAKSRPKLSPKPESKPAGKPAPKEAAIRRPIEPTDDIQVRRDLHRIRMLLENFVLIDAVDQLEGLCGRGRVSEALYREYVDAQATTDYDKQLAFQKKAKQRLNVLMVVE